MQLELWTAVIALAGLAFAGWLAYQLKKQPVLDKKAGEISGYIHEGAMAFLNKEYRILGVFVLIVTLILWFTPGLSGNTAICFVAGAAFSILAGNIGMRIATTANVKTAEAAKESISKGLGMAFSSGNVMGLTVVGLGLLGVSLAYYIFRDPNVIYGFGFGASSVALLPALAAGSTLKPRTSARTWSARLKPAFRKTTRETRPRLPIMSGIMSGTWLAWALTFLKVMLIPLSRPWLSAL